jgi:signal peptidase I
MTFRKWILLSLVFSMLVGCDGRWSSGDRVLVSKCAYDNGVTGPHRFDVVVFKYPVTPVKNGTPTNYIKRLLGLPGELLAIFFGRVYRWNPPEGAPTPFVDPEVSANDLWKTASMHKNDPATQKTFFETGEFDIVRKPPSVLMAMRRLVYDNDYQATDLKGKLDRWNPAPNSGWKADKAIGFVHDGKTGDPTDWLRYQHLARPDGPVAGGGKEKPKLITDSMAYNNFNGQLVTNPNWVGDLMIEADVEIVEPKGEFLFELNKGIFKYQARWDLATGQCNLKSIDINGNEKDLGSAETSVKSPGSYMLRFANIDARLTVWVDRALPFGEGKEYQPPEVRAKHEKDLPSEIIEARRGPQANDLKPASVGSKGAHLKISHVRLWRDTYYTTTPEPGEWDYQPHRVESWSDPAQWDAIRRPHALTMYVQPGHYLCMGDNSQASSDSRSWGVVPERLMLGRALVVYFPLDRVGLIR